MRFIEVRIWPEVMRVEETSDVFVGQEPNDWSKLWEWKLDKTIGPQPGSMAANCNMCFTRLALLLLYLALQHYVIGHILFDLPSPAPKLLPT